ncbi:MAG: hypothetical protein GYB66_10170 [Chloroflexi bacterium]|nr:hypothetical protein [Chloroflexota bacterium]
MDDPVLALAIISLGAFVGVLVSTFIYASTIRPRLLESSDSELQHVQQTLAEQVQTVRALQLTLDAHSQRLLVYVDKLESQGELNQTIEAQLQAIRSEQRDLLHQDPINELRHLLSEQCDALDAMYSVVKDNRQILRAQRQSLTRQLATSSAILQRLTTLMETSPQMSEEQMAALLSQIDHLAKVVQGLSGSPARTTSRTRSQKPLPTRLTDIKGIGPVFSGILHEAGIHTFEDLAELSAEELDALLKLPKWRKVDTQDWIDQARELSQIQQKVTQS